MEIKNIGKNKFEELVSGDYFRVCNKAFMVKIDNDYLYVKNGSIADGLNIERKYREKDGSYHYIVALSLEWSEQDNKAIIQDSASDIIDILKELSDDFIDIISFKEATDELINCYDFAVQTLTDLNEEK